MDGIARVLIASLLASPVASSPSPKHHGKHHGHCPPLDGGTFNITYFQLYPENAVWDAHNCLLYISCLFNGSIAQYDPYKDKVLDIFTFPDITNSGDRHAAGLDWNPHSGLLTIVIDADPPFLTDGADVSGTNFLLKFDPSAKKLLWRANLTSVTDGRWGGFQDVTTDQHGTAYVVGTYPASVLRVSPDGKEIEIWYPPQTTNTTVHGYTGIDSTGDTILVIDNQGVPEQDPHGNAALFRFNMHDAHPKPIRVPFHPATPIGVSDTISLPHKYGGTVALVSLDLQGVTVFRSLDGWRTARQVGTVTSDFGLRNARDLPATFQLVDRIYMIGEFFPGSFVPGTVAGNQSNFPFFDITDQVETLLAEA